VWTNPVGSKQLICFSGETDGAALFRKASSDQHNQQLVRKGLFNFPQSHRKPSSHLIKKASLDFIPTTLFDYKGDSKPKNGDALPGDQECSFAFPGGCGQMMDATTDTVKTNNMVPNVAAVGTWTK
jgi:hypothetical protein